MPKEFVYNRYFGQHASDGVALDDSAVKVGWTKDHDHVEIAIVRGEGEFDESAWHSQFDRNGLNILIRALRRARDDAFGKDA